MNQKPFCDVDNVLFIDGTTDQEQKVAFPSTEIIEDGTYAARFLIEKLGLAD
jgi:hypothetical protein